MVGWLFVDWRFNGYVKGAGCIPGVLETHHTLLFLYSTSSGLFPPYHIQCTFYRHNALMLFFSS